MRSCRLFVWILCIVMVELCFMEFQTLLCDFLMASSHYDHEENRALERCSFSDSRIANLYVSLDPVADGLKYI